MPHTRQKSKGNPEVAKSIAHEDIAKKSVKLLFNKGMEVEVTSDEEGFVGAWYTAKVIRAIPEKNQLRVEYCNLVSDKNTSKRLIETVNFCNVRPRLQSESRKFSLNESVDAWYNDGWWVGVISRVLENSMYLVYFPNSDEEIEFQQSALRVHNDWHNGRWIGAPKQRKLCSIFNVGTEVEVCSDEDGFRGVWFTATIVNVEKDEYIVEYQNLVDDSNKLLRETVYSLHIRPKPPIVLGTRRFKYLDEVDAWHCDGWWIGIVSKVLEESTYAVYFRHSKEEIEFKDSELRLHQDWMDGQWVIASQEQKESKVPCILGEH